MELKRILTHTKIQFDWILCESHAGCIADNLNYARDRGIFSSFNRPHSSFDNRARRNFFVGKTNSRDSIRNVHD